MIKHISKFIGLALNILILFVVLLLMLAGIYFFQTKVEKKDYANIFGYTIFEVITGSMAETINIGDVIIVELSNDIKENDIIVFKENESFITHRLIEIKDNNLITKGDANNSIDKEIVKEAVIGKVVNKISNVSIWREVLSSKEVIISIFITIVLSGFLFHNYDSKRNVQSTKPKELKNDKDEK